MESWTRRRVCRSAAAAALLAAVPRAWAKDPPGKAEVYAKDVDFLLEQLFRKASGLIRQKGIDWKAVEKEFRASVKDVKGDGDHLKLCNRLVARLRDGHAGLRDLKVPWPDESAGRAYGGPGVHVVVIGPKVHVRSAWAQAAAAGLAAGQEIVKIDAKPARAWLDAKVVEMRDTDGYSTDQQALYVACHAGLGGWSGTKVAFDFVKDGNTVHADLDRTNASLVPAGPVFWPKDLKGVGRTSYGRTAAGNGYIHLRDVAGELPAQLDTALAAIGAVPGLVLDVRANGGGGTDHDAVAARFIAAGKQWAGVKSAGATPFAGPLVVIVDAGVRSAGETIAGMFKESSRAYAIGDSATAGMSSKKETITVPSGMFSVLFSTGTHGDGYNGGRGIEAVGVPPHEVVPYDAADLAKGVDTEIRRAEELLRDGFPKGAVRYSQRL